MIRLAALLSLALVTFGLRAEDNKKTPFGKIERIDPTFDAIVPKDAEMEKLADGFDWSEGPAWSTEGKYLIFSDIPKNTIWKWTNAKGIELYMKPSGYTGEAPFTGKEPGSNGIAIDKDGSVILCQHGDRRVLRIAKDGTKTILAEKYEGKRLNSPNDLAIKSNGDIYFTDPPYGLPKLTEDPGKELPYQGVYRLSKDGKLTLLTKEMTRPNGIAFSPDEKTLYVANSDPAMAIWKAFPVKTDGTIGEGKIFFDSTKSVGKEHPGLPDGMKVDTKGNVYATGPGGVLVFNADGKHLGTFATGVPTANCGWGDDGTVLYITADKSLARIKLSAKGW